MQEPESSQELRSSAQRTSTPQGVFRRQLVRSIHCVCLLYPLLDLTRLPSDLDPQDVLRTSTLSLCRTRSHRRLCGPYHPERLATILWLRNLSPAWSAIIANNNWTLEDLKRLPLVNAIVSERASYRLFARAYVSLTSQYLEEPRALCASGLSENVQRLYVDGSVFSKHLPHNYGIGAARYFNSILGLGWMLSQLNSPCLRVSHRVA